MDRLELNWGTEAGVVLGALLAALVGVGWWKRRSQLAIILCSLTAVVGVAAIGLQMWAATPIETLGTPTLPETFQKLTPLHKPLGKPEPGDWLTAHEEKGQTYGRYVASRPVRPDKQRKTICVQPLGEFTASQRKILRLTADYLGHFYQLPVRVCDDLPLTLVPASARRENPNSRDSQILTGYVLQTVLKPQLPNDAVTYLALTAADLWPGEGWNYVFGQASLADRVGVWSLHRLGNPDESAESFRQTLRRTLHISAHETGHMFSLPHCIYYECCMCGANNLREVDRQPLWLCPQCLGKACYATGADPEKRFAALIEFARGQGLDRDVDFWRLSLATLREK